MLNRWKFEGKILEIACSGKSLAVRNGKPAACDPETCSECDFCGMRCDEKIKEWADSEYVEQPVDWSKVPVDTPILVKDTESESFTHRYFAKYEDNMVYAWESGATSWSVDKPERITGWEYAKLVENGY